MANWVASHAVPLIHVSIGYGFDGSAKSAWREDDVTAPLLVREVKACGREGGPRSRCTRSDRQDVLGICQSGAHFYVGGCSSEPEELRIVCDQSGAPISARAIADAVTQMTEAGLRSLRNRISAIRDHHLPSWFGFAEAILDELRKQDLGAGRSASYRLRVRTNRRGPCVHQLSTRFRPGARDVLDQHADPPRRARWRARGLPNSGAYRLRHLHRLLRTG